MYKSKNFQKPVIIIAAYSKNNVIGSEGKIPWNIPSERDKFKEICSNKKIIMGRKSFQEIGKGLSYCTIIVISKSLTSVPERCLLAESFEEACELCKDQEELIIAGGQKVYEYAMKYCDTIYATEVDIEISGDTFFPKIPEEFTLCQEQGFNGEIPYKYLCYKKK